MYVRVMKIMLLSALVLGYCGPVSAKDDAKEIFETVCSLCHNDALNPLDNVHHTRQEWNEILLRMITVNLAPFEAGKIPELVNYLLKEHGPN